MKPHEYLYLASVVLALVFVIISGIVFGVWLVLDTIHRCRAMDEFIRSQRQLLDAQREANRELRRSVEQLDAL